MSKKETNRKRWSNAGNISHEAYEEIISRLDSLQSDVETLQSAIGRIDAASREITEAKQSIYYLIAATDELRKICNVDPESQE